MLRTVFETSIYFRDKIFFWRVSFCPGSQKAEGPILILETKKKDFLNGEFALRTKKQEFLGALEIKARLRHMKSCL